MESFRRVQDKVVFVTLLNLEMIGKVSE